MLDITGEYHFTITKHDGWYIATGITPKKHLDGVIATQGRNEEEIFTMIADSYLTALSIPKRSFWKRLFNRI